MHLNYLCEYNAKMHGKYANSTTNIITTMMVSLYAKIAQYCQSILTTKSQVLYT